MFELVNGLLEGQKMSLRAFYCKVRGGGGRLRHATGRMKKENVRWVPGVIKAKAGAVAELRLLLVGVVVVLSITLYSMLKLLTIIPDCEKTDCEDSRLLRHYRMVH